MAKKNELSKDKLNYFQKRFLRIQKHNIERTDNYIKGFEKRQKELSDSLNKELDIFIKRYADEDKISMKEASKLISKQQRSELKMSLEEFRQKALEGGHDVELNKIYYTTRVTRLDALQAQLNMLTAESSFNETDELAQHLKDTYKDTYLRNIYELTDRGNVTLTFSTFSEARLQKVLSKDWLGSDFSKRIWKNQTQLLPQQLEKVMAQATVTGWSIDRTVKEFKRYTDNVATNRMYTLINTESAHIADEAAQEAYRRTGIEKYDWMATFEIHTCPICADLDGQSFRVDDPLAPRPPSPHPNCVLPNNIVIAPDAEAMTRSFYSGDVIEIATSQTDGISVTPNHIMLTSRGWVRAKDIIKGDKIINYSRWKEFTSRFIASPTNDDSKPTVENLFTALLKSGFVSPSSMPATSVDFKGDVIENSNIDIININSFLRDKWDSSFAQLIGNENLVSTSEKSSFLNSVSFFKKCLAGFGLASDGIMSGARIADILLLGSLSHHDLISKRLPSHYNARLFKATFDNCPRNAKLFSQSVNAHAGFVKRNDLSNWNRLFSIRISNTNSIFFNNFSDWFSRNVKDIRDLCDRLTGIVSCDDVVDIKVFHYSGHVYDISSQSTLYTINGYISSNCRCTTVPHLDGLEITERWARDPETGKGALVDSKTFDEWKKKQHNIANDAIIGMKTSDGITISRTSQHLVQRTVERSIKPNEIKEALTNPIYIRPDKVQDSGISRKYVGRSVSVAVNPENGTIITAHKTGSRTVRKYTKEE
nr:minor capsid protein [Bavariicoccus seileri]